VHQTHQDLPLSTALSLFRGTCFCGFLKRLLSERTEQVLMFFKEGAVPFGPLRQVDGTLFSQRFVLLRNVECPKFPMLVLSERFSFRIKKCGLQEPGRRDGT
jgi:hypothetical protein